MGCLNVSVSRVEEAVRVFFGVICTVTDPDTYMVLESGDNLVTELDDFLIL